MRDAEPGLLLLLLVLVMMIAQAMMMCERRPQPISWMRAAVQYSLTGV